MLNTTVCDLVYILKAVILLIKEALVYKENHQTSTETLKSLSFKIEIEQNLPQAKIKPTTSELQNLECYRLFRAIYCSIDKIFAMFCF